jgi:hypothetical protein
MLIEMNFMEKNSELTFVKISNCSPVQDFANEKSAFSFGFPNSIAYLSCVRSSGAVSLSTFPLAKGVTRNTQVTGYRDEAAIRFAMENIADLIII